MRKIRILQKSRFSVLFISVLFIAVTSECITKNNKNINNPYYSMQSEMINGETQKVSILLLQFSNFSKEIISNGRLVAFKKADLSFRSSEKISSIYIKNGERVLKDQIIAKLDDFELSNTLKQCLTQLEKSKIDCQDILLSQGFDPNNPVMIPEVTMKTALVRSGYDQAKTNLELAEYNLRTSILRAPFSGIVADLTLNENNFSNQYERFCTIIDDSHFEAEFPVLESELASIRQGQTVRILPFALNNFILKGEIIRINPRVDQNGMLKIVAVCNNAIQKLYDGMNVKIVIEELVPHQLVLPKQAVVLRNEKQVVFTYKGGKAQWTYVQTGLENISSVVITQGLHEGDTVIYEGNTNLAHDSKVYISN